MPTWQQEMGWYCAACRKLNRGRFKECQSCGKAKDREPFVDLPEEGEGIEWAVRDPDLLEQAEAGPDWECVLCRSHQRRDDGKCANCGAGQDESEDHETEWDDREDLHKPHSSPLRRRPRPSDADPPAGTVSLSPVLTPASVLRPRPSSRRRTWALSVLAALLAVAAASVYLLLRTRIVDATVESVRWEHRVHVDRYRVVEGEGFDEDKPGDAFDVVSRGERFHHNEQVACGVNPRICTPIPETCTTTPVTCSGNQNGFKTCSGGDRVCTGGGESCTGGDTRYCDDPVDEEWYSWKAWRWRPDRTVREGGSRVKTRWPKESKVALNKGLSEGQKERVRREASYETVFVDTDGDRYEYEPETLKEFSSLPPGSRKKLRVRAVGSPEIVRE